MIEKGRKSVEKVWYGLNFARMYHPIYGMARAFKPLKVGFRKAENLIFSNIVLHGYFIILDEFVH